MSLTLSLSKMSRQTHPPLVHTLLSTITSFVGLENTKDEKIEINCAVTTNELQKSRRNQKSFVIIEDVIL